MEEGKESKKNLLKIIFYDFRTEGQNQSVKTVVKRNFILPNKEIYFYIYAQN